MPTTSAYSVVYSTWINRGPDRHDVSKEPEFSNPFDPGSSRTGNTWYILSEVYETKDWR